MSNEFKDRFYENLDKIISTKRDDNSAYLSREKYDLICNQVKEAKRQAKKTALSYRRLAKYDVVNVANHFKLIAPLQEGKETFLYYVKKEELFDILYEVHLSIDHEGRTRMLNFLNDKFKNITQEVVTLFLFYRHTLLPAAKIGDTVRLPVPDVDRGRADARNILGVVTTVEDNMYYIILGQKRAHYHSYLQEISSVYVRLPLLLPKKFQLLKNLFVRLQRLHLYVVVKDTKDARAKLNVVQKSAAVRQLIFFMQL
uniref:Uncharacterized protein LOC114326700 isoform X1 n=1 Tax=Diabrotica virgifera virgifera TaxID=50390 RepID=A0A6P7FBM7_DIAVI